MNLPFTYTIDGNQTIHEHDNLKEALKVASDVGQHLLRGDKQGAAFALLGGVIKGVQEASASKHAGGAAAANLKYQTKGDVIQFR